MPFGVELGGLPATAVAVGGGLGALVLTALYLGRRRPRRLLVPFVSIWFSTSAEGFAARLARRLRRIWSLAIQLAILALVLVAAADPRPSARDATSRTIVILLDRSASMQTGDESSPHQPGARIESASRLGRARVVARQIIDGLGPDDRALVASFAADVTAATGFETDRMRLRTAADAIGPSDEPGDLAGALSFCATMLHGRPHPTLILIGDGGGPAIAIDDDTVTSLGGIDVRFAPVGRRRDNLAIVAFSARRAQGDPSSVDITLVVQSFRDAPSDVTVTISSGPSRVPVARRRLHLRAGDRVVENLSGLAAPDARLEALMEDAADDLPLDDRAFAVIPEPARLKVLAIGGRNLYLDGALLGLAATVQVDRLPPGAAENSRPRWQQYDAVIFDGAMPDTPPEAGRFLYLDPHGKGSPWAEHGAVQDPIVTDVIGDHPLIKQLSLRDLNVAVARRLTLRPDDVAVASALRTPLILARARRHTREVGLAFDPRQSDLPLRSAFPLFLANALAWLANQSVTESLSWPTGRTVRIEVAGPRGAAADREIDVISPNGSRSRTPVIAGGVMLALDQIGIFTLSTAKGDRVTHVAANLASAIESDVAPHRNPSIGKRTIATFDVPPPARRRKPALLAVLGALALCSSEWLSFHRRLTM
jgi:von Willebrand factor type A domain